MTSDTNMVERVARELAEALSGSPSYVEAENLASATIDGCFDLVAVARAAIKAMREPTEAMRHAYANPSFGGPLVGKEGIYRAMIDAALSQEPTK